MMMMMMEGRERDKKRNKRGLNHTRHIIADNVKSKDHIILHCIFNLRKKRSKGKRKAKQKITKQQKIHFKTPLTSLPTSFKPLYQHTPQTTKSTKRAKPQEVKHTINEAKDTQSANTYITYRRDPPSLAYSWN